MRLTAQRLGTTSSASPADAVRWMLAVQAQELPGAKWSLGLRTTRCTEAAVDAALDAGEVVRSWPLRGTLHLVAAEDVVWLLSLTGLRQIGRAASRRSALGITDSDIGLADEAVRAALAGRRTLPRDQLLARIRAAGVATDGQRGYHLIWHLAHAGTLVMGAADGRGQAFALLEDWVTIPRALDRDEALGQLALRYLRSHGPASDADLARWAGIPLGEARRGRAICGAALATIELGGRTYHLDPETLDRETGAVPPPPTRALLLPGFDEYLLGYGDRSAVLAPEHADRIVPGGNGLFRPTIVVDGRVVGTWRRTARAGEINVVPELFGPPDAELLAGLLDAARVYGSFLGRDARLATIETRWPGASR
jgi:DNA glycosylase AlkZ-like